MVFWFYWESILEVRKEILYTPFLLKKIFGHQKLKSGSENLDHQTNIAMQKFTTLYKWKTIEICSKIL
jgi:hypothetical protein